MSPDAVTQLVVATFAELGIGEAEHITRTILLRDRYYVGCEFRFGDRRAVWFVDGNVLKFYGADGTLLRKVNPGEQAKKAA